MENSTKILLGVGAGAGIALVLLYNKYGRTSSGNSKTKSGSISAGAGVATVVKGQIMGVSSNGMRDNNVPLPNCQKYIFHKDMTIGADGPLHMPCSLSEGQKYPKCETPTKTYKKGESICGVFRQGSDPGSRAGGGTGPQPGAASESPNLRWVDGGAQYSVIGQDAVDMHKFSTDTTHMYAGFAGNERRWQNFR